MDDSGYCPYKPSKTGATTAMLLFGSSAFVHLWQNLKKTAWFFTAFLIGFFSKSTSDHPDWCQDPITRISEADENGMMVMTPRYIFRLISACSPDNPEAYICQSMYIILPPSLYAATIYMTYSRVVVQVGKPHLSIISPEKMTKVFVLGDITAFLLPLGGGGMQTVDSMRNIGQKFWLSGYLCS
ncbi:RTA1 like protein-domain-containing protein [Aspergillus nidulans var. acristatus]